MFKDKEAARHWLDSIIWKDGKLGYHHCSGTNTYEVKNSESLPHRCRDYRKHYVSELSVRHNF